MTLFRLKSALVLSMGTSALALTAPAAAQQAQEKKLGWQDRAELALVITAGNSSASTLGFRNLLSRVWEDAELHFEASGLRTETATFTLIPVGTSADDFVLQEDSDSALTAENYLARAKVDRQFSRRFFAFGTGGWDRNVFAGIQNRYNGAGGLGNIWADREDMRYRTDYGISVTTEDPTIGSNLTYAGLRLSSDFLRRLAASTTLTNLTIAEENLDRTDDFRLDSLTALAVSMTERLAIQLSLKFLFDNVPSFVEADLIAPVTGLPVGIRVPVQANKLDTLFNVALVVNF